MANFGEIDWSKAANQSNADARRTANAMSGVDDREARKRYVAHMEATRAVSRAQYRLAALQAQLINPGPNVSQAARSALARRVVTAEHDLAIERQRADALEPAESRARRQVAERRANEAARRLATKPSRAARPSATRTPATTSPALRNWGTRSATTANGSTSAGALPYTRDQARKILTAHRGGAPLPAEVTNRLMALGVPQSTVVDTARQLLLEISR